MLTIGQLAAYSGVTIRAVRHYHQVGLLPEPERDASGYRTYTAPDVVRLVRIRTLAEAGVPLARVQDLLEAGEEEFAAAVADLDRRLRAQVRELQEHRRRIARLAAGDSLALPPAVVAYLDRLRSLGVPEAMVAGERDAWIVIAARWPEQMGSFMADKNAQLDDPRTVRLYRILGELIEHGLDEDRLVELADLMAQQMAEYVAGGGTGDVAAMSDDTVVDLLDAWADASHPMVERLRELLAERGWTGWIRIEPATPPALGP